MPNQAGSYFADSVIYLCRHDHEGAFGLVLNRAMDLSFETLLQQAGLSEIQEQGAVKAMPPIRSGGPVRPEQGIVLHTDDLNFDDTEQLGQGLSLSFSRDMLAAIAAGQGPSAWLFALGYAGWGGGQLEAELERDAWLAVHAGTAPNSAQSPTARELLFDVNAEQSLEAVSRLAGVELKFLSGRSGVA